MTVNGCVSKVVARTAVVRHRAGRLWRRHAPRAADTTEYSTGPLAEVRLEARGEAQTKCNVPGSTLIAMLCKHISNFK